MPVRMASTSTLEVMAKPLLHEPPLGVWNNQRRTPPAFGAYELRHLVAAHRQGVAQRSRRPQYRSIHYVGYLGLVECSGIARIPDAKGILANSTTDKLHTCFLNDA
jgi:hypothetical protein